MLLAGLEAGLTHGSHVAGVGGVFVALGLLRLLQTELGLVISLTQIEMPLMLLPLQFCCAETAGFTTLNC